MEFDPAKAVDHANKFWWRCCDDFTVVTREKQLTRTDMFRGRGLKDNEWLPIFLFYGSAPTGKNKQRPEGLFLVRKDNYSVEKGIAAKFDAAAIEANSGPLHFVCSWSDTVKEDAIGQTPTFTGLNDCAHFSASAS